jgi:hypothetical protein
MSSCFFAGRYIAQQVAGEQREAVTRRVRDMFPEINLPPLQAAVPPPAQQDADERSVVYNGNVYKSLAGHDPHSRVGWNSDESRKLYNLEPPWQICPKTPDALHVCAAYPWGTHALVFSDGSAHWTFRSYSDAGYTSGSEAPTFRRLRQEGCQYGAEKIRVHNEAAMWHDHTYNPDRDDPEYFTDVLIVRKL